MEIALFWLFAKHKQWEREKWWLKSCFALNYVRETNKKAIKLNAIWIQIVTQSHKEREREVTVNHKPFGILINAGVLARKWQNQQVICVLASSFDASQFQQNSVNSTLTFYQHHEKWVLVTRSQLDENKCWLYSNIKTISVWVGICVQCEHAI